MRWWNIAGAALLMAGCGAGEDAAQAPRGEQVYTRFCYSCHAAGVAGAPRVGDPDAWAPRVAKGREALLATTIEGVPPGMPPRGLCSDCTDQELADAIDYMIERSR